MGCPSLVVRDHKSVQSSVNAILTHIIRLLIFFLLQSILFQSFALLPPPHTYVCSISRRNSVSNIIESTVFFLLVWGLEKNHYTTINKILSIINTHTHTCMTHTHTHNFTRNKQTYSDTFIHVLSRYYLVSSISFYPTI